MGIGRVRDFTLAEAREKARDVRRLVSQGIDPIDERQGKRDAALAEAIKRITFKEVTHKYLTAHSDKWSQKHASECRDTLQRYAFPVLADLPVDAIEVPHIIKVIDPIWKGKQTTAKRLLGRIENVLAYATVHKWREGDNPARWQGHLQTVFGASHTVTSHIALPVAKIPAFMATLRACDRVGARALEFCILTATRRDEARLARWSEFDFDAAIWTIPAERMKKAREHAVPLSQRALEILSSLPRNGELVFNVGSNSMGREVERIVPRSEATLHGFRSTFRDWAGDLTAFDRETIEHALAHSLPNAVEAAYRRSTALNKRALLMEAWAGYCAGERLGENVYKLSNK
jgi:integrase